jgi:ATP-dependent Clp protease ATP-binding subunit ClpA
MNQKQEQPDTKGQTMTALTSAELEQVSDFFQSRLIGQSEVVQTLTNVLYKQNALLKRLLEHDREAEQPVGIPPDPTVLLLMGGSWGKSLAARLIPMAMERLGRGSMTVLTPLPQDPEGTLNIEPPAMAAPFATVVIENIEAAQRINARFVANLAHLLDTGLIALVDPSQRAVHPVPLGLSTFIMTSSIADAEIRETLNPETRIGFLHPTDDQAVDVEAAYEKVQKICRRALGLLPHELLRTVDETVILRPLSESDLLEVFDLEIAHYQQVMFPGRQLTIAFQDDAKAFLFAEARDGLGIYGAHALRRVLQRHIDPVVYRAYNSGTLTENNLEEHKVVVSLEGDAVSVRLE